MNHNRYDSWTGLMPATWRLSQRKSSLASSNPAFGNNGDAWRHHRLVVVVDNAYLYELDNGLRYYFKCPLLVLDLMAWTEDWVCCPQSSGEPTVRIHCELRVDGKSFHHTCDRKYVLVRSHRFPMQKDTSLSRSASRHYFPVKLARLLKPWVR